MRALPISATRFAAAIVRLSVVVVFIGLLAICNSMAGAIWSYLIKEYPTPFPKSTFGFAGVMTCLLICAREAAPLRSAASSMVSS